MIYRMIARERVCHNVQPEETQTASRRSLRQIFVTQSPNLAEKVEGYYERMSAFLASGNSPLNERNSRNNLDKDDDGLYVVDEDDVHREDLPQKFSDLQDRHFPLFLTFHQVGICVVSANVLLRHCLDSCVNCSKQTMPTRIGVQVRVSFVCLSVRRRKRRPLFLSATFFTRIGGIFLST